MIGEKNFVPNILLCGNDEEFVSRAGDRPHKIVGHVQFTGKVDGGGIVILILPKTTGF